MLKSQKPRDGMKLCQQGSEPAVFLNHNVGVVSDITGKHVNRGGWTDSLHCSGLL